MTRGRAVIMPQQFLGHVLRPDELLDRATYDHATPCAPLQPWVERYWSVRWELGPGEVFRTATLDDPSVNLSHEQGVRRSGVDGSGWWVTGPITRGRFDVELLGRGHVVGVKLRVGGALAFAPVDLPALRDRTAPLGAWFGSRVPPELPSSAGQAASLLDEWLLSFAPQDPEGLPSLRGALAVLDDPTVTTLHLLEQRTGLRTRTLQRLFSRLVGVGPKRMLVRARVMDAVAAIDGGIADDFALLATDLGWTDQSHFIRDFQRFTGETPARYAARRPAS